MGIRDRFRRLNTEAEDIARNVATDMSRSEDGALPLSSFSAEHQIWKQMDEIYRGSPEAKRSQVYQNMVAMLPVQTASIATVASGERDAMADFSRYVTIAEEGTPPLPADAPVKAPARENGRSAA